MQANPHILHLQRLLDDYGTDYRRALADVQLKRVTAQQAETAGTALVTKTIRVIEQHLAKGRQPVIQEAAEVGWQVWCDAPVVLQRGTNSLFGVVLWYHGEVRFAVALDFENQVLYWAGPGEGAHMGQKARVADRATVAGAFISVPAWPVPAGLTEQGAQVLISQQPLADVLAVAQGAQDGCVQAGLPYTHNAAAQMFIQEAGGLLTDKKSQPLTATTQCIVAANSKLQGQLLKALHA